MQAPSSLHSLTFLRMEVLFIILFAHVRKIRAEKLAKMAEVAEATAIKTLPTRAKIVVPAMMK